MMKENRRPASRDWNNTAHFEPLVANMVLIDASDNVDPSNDFN
ncbi:hypothetical protein M6B38_415585 [Iris pallida]|uniref:Uncharacterized protein n=1 Tax=Iris pallida TaxID=29817 RepID=A0AAX6FL73_IRIPA|nr:hypothetical protein M6B38_415585 [Iris pallida]